MREKVAEKRKGVAKETLRSNIKSYIQRMIAEGVYKPGDRIVETRLAKELNVEPVIDANMALGEGTGAVMMFSLLDIALSVYQNRTTFSDINIEQYERFSHK